MDRIQYVGTILVALACLAGCKKQEAETAAPTAAAEAAPKPEHRGKELIPGESEVRANLKSKNYTEAVNGVMAMQGVLATSEQKAEWAVLFQEVRDALQDASPSDPKAAEALGTLRALRQGR
jgi:hypothetical protein